MLTRIHLFFFFCCVTSGASLDIASFKHDVEVGMEDIANLRAQLRSVETSLLAEFGQWGVQFESVVHNMVREQLAPLEQRLQRATTR